MAGSDREAAIRKALCNPTGSYVEATRALDALVEREWLLMEALERIASIPASADDDGILARGIARIALYVAGEQRL